MTYIYINRNADFDETEVSLDPFEPYDNPVSLEDVCRLMDDINNESPCEEYAMPDPEDIQDTLEDYWSVKLTDGGAKLVREALKNLWFGNWTWEDIERELGSKRNFFEVPNYDEDYY